MKRGCLLSLLLWAALIYAYSLWLGQTFQDKELWIGSTIAGLLATFGIGALFNSYYAWRDGRVLADALSDLPREHGRRTAVAGTMEPLGQPLIAPLSGKSCVLYEYDIYRIDTHARKGGGTSTTRQSDFAGLGMAECVIKSTHHRFQLLGFPDLDPLKENRLIEPDDYARAKEYVQFTAWEDTSGLDLLRGVRDMFAALTGEFESLKKDWRLISVRKCPWLTQGSASPSQSDISKLADPFESGEKDQFLFPQQVEEDEFSSEDAFESDPEEQPEQITWRDGSGYRPELMEKRIHVGQPVVMLGEYDEMRQGIISGGSQPIKIYLEEVQVVAKKLNSGKWTNLIGGIVALVILNLAVWGVQVAYRHHEQKQQAWHRTPVNFLASPYEI